MSLKIVVCQRVYLLMDWAATENAHCTPFCAITQLCTSFFVATTKKAVKSCTVRKSAQNQQLCTRVFNLRRWSHELDWLVGCSGVRFGVRMNAIGHAVWRHEWQAEWR